MVSNINIKDSYTLEFMTEGESYEIELYYFIDFLRDYYCDDIIENSDGLCDLISFYCNSYDLTEVIRIVEELDANDVNHYDYFILDGVYYYVTPVNDFNDISDIYDISDVLENIASDLDHLEYYCDKV